MASIPEFFFLNGQLHKRLAVVRSDSSVRAFNYKEEQRVSVPLAFALKNYKKAFTYAHAAKLIRTTSGKLKEIVNNGLHPAPARVFDLNTYERKTAYFSEDQLYILRNICYDLLPKNRYDIPYNDTLASEEELRHAIRLTDERDYTKVDSDGTVRVFRV